MKDLKVFSFEGKQARIVMRDGNPWWVAKDVCDILEMANPTEAIKALDDDEKNTLRISEGIQGRGNPNVNIINESGLWKLILRSSKPEAKRLSKWVTSEVLPSIRKTGSYSFKGKDDIIDLQRKRLALQDKNANARLAKIMQRMVEHPAYPITDDSKRVLVHEITLLATGMKHPEMLPDASGKLYNNGDIGKELNVKNRDIMKHARAIGILAPEGESNEYGTWKMTKSLYSPHECAQWYYTEAGRKKVIESYGRAA
jgi:prophage antirepressor-like protein